MTPRMFHDGADVGFSYPQNVRFQCARCGLCCGDTETKTRRILLLEADVKRASEASSKPVEDFAFKVEGYEPYVWEMRKTANAGKCVFLNGNNCAIYTSRPLICIFYPFELRAGKKGTHEFHYTIECAGIGRGRRLGKSYFENLFKQILANTE